MKRALRVLVILTLVAILLFAVWAFRRDSAGRSGQASLKNAIHSAITNPMGFVRARVTGGVGAALGVDPATGVPVIIQVMPGSPAENAGLLKGDLILRVNGVATSGRMLAQNVESIRGIATGSVALTVQRPGFTNKEFVIRRSSWNSLGVPQ